jgi:DNA-binding CsgD family transcriptional regulator
MKGGVPLLEQAVADAGGDPSLHADLHHRLALLGRFARGRRWAEAHARTAVELADEIGDDGLRARALAALALMRFDQGDPAGRADAERALELAGHLSDPAELLEVQWIVGHVRTWSTDLPAARELLEAMRAAWRDRDERNANAVLWYLAVLEWREGRWQDALRHGQEVYDVAHQYGLPRPQQTFPLAVAAAHLGDLELARRIAEEGCSLAADTDAQLGGLVALVGLVDLWRGGARAAATAFAAAEEQAAAADWAEPNLCWWRAEYAEALLELGRIDEAEALLDRWDEVAVRVGREWALAHSRRARGLVAAARHDVVGALALLEEAAVRHDAAGDPFGRARALYTLGVVRRRARQKRPARDALVEALAAFTALGAATWAERAGEELGRIGGRTAVDGLTPAERRVAALVAEGRTNREVAAALFLGERTVASHLTHIYAKLDVRSRTELARKLQTF